MPLIVGLLPMILLLALLLFFVGLSLFIFTLSSAIASLVVALAFIIYTAYLVTNVLPMLDPGCPYKTPVSNYAYIALKYLATFLPSEPIISRRLKSLREMWGPATGTGLPTSQETPLSRQQQAHAPATYGANAVPAWTVRHRETDAITKREDLLVVNCITWLYSTLSNPTVSSITLQAISGLSETAITKLREASCDRMCDDIILRLNNADMDDHHLRERLGRSFLFINGSHFNAYVDSCRLGDILAYLYTHYKKTDIRYTSFVVLYRITTNVLVNAPVRPVASVSNGRHVHHNLSKMRLHRYLWTRALENVFLGFKSELASNTRYGLSEAFKLGIEVVVHIWGALTKQTGIAEIRSPATTLHAASSSPTIRNLVVEIMQKIICRSASRCSVCQGSVSLVYCQSPTRHR